MIGAPHVLPQSYDMTVSLDPADKLLAAKVEALALRGLEPQLSFPIRIEGFPDALLPLLAFFTAKPAKAEQVREVPFPRG